MAPKSKAPKEHSKGRELPSVENTIATQAGTKEISAIPASATTIVPENTKSGAANLETDDASIAPNVARKTAGLQRRSTWKEEDLARAKQEELARAEEERRTAKNKTQRERYRRKMEGGAAAEAEADAQAKQIEDAQAKQIEERQAEQKPENANRGGEQVAKQGQEGLSEQKSGFLSQKIEKEETASQGGLSLASPAIPPAAPSQNIPVSTPALQRAIGIAGENDHVYLNNKEIRRMMELARDRSYADFLEENGFRFR